MDNYLVHYGVPGQKWGDRKYQYEDGSLTPEGRRHYGYSERRKKFNGKSPNTTHKIGKIMQFAGGAAAIGGIAGGEVAKRITPKRYNDLMFRDLALDFRKNDIDRGQNMIAIAGVGGIVAGTLLRRKGTKLANRNNQQ